MMFNSASMCLHHCWATHPPFTSHFRGGFTKLGFPQENTRHFARRAFFHLCGKVLNLIFATFPCQRRARLMLLLLLSDISGEEYLDFYIILLTCVLKSLLLLRVLFKSRSQNFRIKKNIWPGTIFRRTFTLVKMLVQFFKIKFNNIT